MIRLSSRSGAVSLLVLAGVYLVLSLAFDRSARSEPPPDFAASAAESGVDVWKAAALVLGDSDAARIVDVRRPEEFELYHPIGATNEPGLDAEGLVRLAREHPQIVVAATDEDVRKLVGEARAVDPGVRVHYLIDGPRSWYLAFELPVPLFADAPAPSGYAEALRTVRRSLQKPGAAENDGAIEAVRWLAKLDYQPTRLKQSGKPKAAAGARKKISGGCGS